MCSHLSLCERSFACWEMQPTVVATLPLFGSETETDTEQRRKLKFARVHCVRRCARSPSPAPDAPRRPYARVRRLVRRKQPNKQRTIDSAVQTSVQTFNEITKAKDELMGVFEFEPGVPVAPTVDFFHGDYGDSDTDGGDDDSDCYADVLEQHKWWLQDRVRVRFSS